MTRFALLGAGWRAQFFLRAAGALPGQLACAGVWARRQEAADEIAAKYHVPTFTDVEALLAEKPEYVIVSLPHAPAFTWVKELIGRGIPVLSETPPAPDLAALDELWQLCAEKKPLLQVAEQYFAQPYHRAVAHMVEEGLLGEVHSVDISMLHGYHAASIFRRLLGVGTMACTVQGKRYHDTVTKTWSRYGTQQRELATPARDVAVFEFANGKTAHYDFCGEQYHSQIRSKSLRVCGERGELRDNTLRWLNGQDEAVVDELQRRQWGMWSDLDGHSLYQLQLAGRVLYENPFAELGGVGDMRRLTDDEIAIADLMVGMGAYVQGGAEPYPLREAFMDTHLHFALAEAMETGETVQVAGKPWTDDQMT